ncbi:MAG: IgGFc-binding protein [Deltaproteobacteria bacterium]|nr:IgGFc-binding protein [Deltaproteobacteria bacterium]
MRPFVILLALTLLAGCWEPNPGGEFRTPEPPTPEVDTTQLCTQDGATRCDDNRFQTCLDGAWTAGIQCETPTPLCHDQDGCGGCPAGTAYCLGRDVYQCSDDGSFAALTETCSDTESCLAGACYDACAAAESQLSYLGCSFMAVPTANMLGDAFEGDFAVVVGNPHDVAAEVVIRHQGSAYDVVEVPAEDSLAITLPYLTSLQGSSANTVVDDGAYELRTSMPVAAYQYNPLHFQAPSNPNAYSYTNDASLLIPEHALTGNYVVSGWPSLGIGDAPALSYNWIPGFVAVTATRNTTQVTLTTSAETVGGAVGPLSVGESTTVTLDRGDVLQVFSHQPEEDAANPCTALGGDRTQIGDSDLCLSVSSGDLTGTVIEANNPVAVFAGHVCTFVPYYEWACDHLEEAMMPLETWGNTIAVSAPTFPGGTSRAPTWVRIISVTEGNLLRFDPPIQPDQFLDAGGILEFEADEHFVVAAGSPILVTQFMQGQQALGAEEGDPSMGVAVPTSQWRHEYDFLTPDTYVWNHLGVVTTEGAQVYLDSQLVMDWEPVGESGLVVSRLLIEPGGHRIVSVDEVPFGITSYGYAPFTSYLHPGGLNLLR